jgi:hypothetical protein
VKRQDRKRRWKRKDKIKCRKRKWRKRRKEEDKKRNNIPALHAVFNPVFSEKAPLIKKHFLLMTFIWEERRCWRIRSHRKWKCYIRRIIICTPGQELLHGWNTGNCNAADLFTQESGSVGWNHWWKGPLERLKFTNHSNQIKKQVP